MDSGSPFAVIVVGQPMLRRRHPARSTNLALHALTAAFAAEHAIID